jgi:hypothetical protein
MVTESTANQAAADPVQLGAASWREHLARLDGFQWTCLAAILAASLLRDTRQFQWQLGQTYITIHLAMLMALSVWAFFRLLASRFEHVTTGLFISGCVFCMYAIAIDSLRALDFLGPLTIDLAYVGCPILIAAAYFSGESMADNNSPMLVLCVLLALIMLLYMGVAYFAYSLNVGDLVGPRIRNLENLPFARIGGPLGGATALCLATIPAISWLYERAKQQAGNPLALWIAITILIVASLWTVSRVGVALLLLLLAIQFPKHRVIAACMVLLSIALAMGWGLDQLPEKWVTMGVSDPGRVNAFGTTMAALTSDKTAMITGVGSQRLNIITQTSAAVSRGDLTFNSWATEFGTFPYGPHSILWWALGSYGLVGAVLRCWFLGELYWIGTTFKAGTFPWAVIISSFSLFLDDTHIVYPFLMIIWFIFYIYALEKVRS